MPTRRRRFIPLTKAEKIEYREKSLAVWESEIRTYHAQIAELQDKVVHAERMRDETRRELEELRGSV